MYDPLRVNQTIKSLIDEKFLDVDQNEERATMC